MYAIEADNLLHPNLAPGLPPFVPDFASPARLLRLSPPRQLAFLAARAGRGGYREKILYGVALQSLGRPLSAEREFRAAAALAPDNPEARTAAAVGLFDKDDPALAFGRLGPLTQVFPHAATVRFHLGLMLLWLGRAEQGKAQLRLARAEAPGSRLAREAERFLARLAGGGTNQRKR
jgi:Flp pilus assembly protein TadD